MFHFSRIWNEQKGLHLQGSLYRIQPYMVVKIQHIIATTKGAEIGERRDVGPNITQYLENPNRMRIITALNLA